MTVEIAAEVEKELRRFADRQGREIHVVVQDAIQDYLVAASITDVSPEQIGEAQIQMAAELQELTPWTEDEV